MKNIILIVLALAAFVLGNSVFVVRENERAVLLQFGRVLRSDYAPGLHWKVPALQNVRKFERRIVTLDKEPQRYLTSERKDVLVDFFVKWKIKDVARFYTASSGDERLAESRLDSTTRNALGKEIVKRTLQEVVSDQRSELMAELRKNISEAVEELGIEVVDLRVMRIDLPDEVSQKVFDRMTSERKAVANKLRSQGTEAAEKIRANAERDAQIAMAEAQRDAQRLRGSGDAEAAKIYAEAYNRDAEFYAFWRSLEAYRASFAEPGSVLVLDPKSEFFQYFGEGAKP
ncbi:MAG TPA: protease modulator HflC [Patescibacteria group bacterium]|nr:protease modulator HflC [Patescibacteria group bacterium]